MSWPTIHAGCVVVGEAGILIRGPAGSGKSSFARRLVAAARAGGAFARHVADDRVGVRERGGRLVARPHQALAGRHELRGLGLVAVADPAPAAVLRLVVDLGVLPARMPPAPLPRVRLEGVALPLLALAGEVGHPDGSSLDALAADLALWLAAGGLAREEAAAEAKEARMPFSPVASSSRA